MISGRIGSGIGKQLWKAPSLSTAAEAGLKASKRTKKWAMHRLTMTGSITGRWITQARAINICEVVKQLFFGDPYLAR